MKKITISLFFCFLFYSSFSQWNAQTSGTTNAFTSVNFINTTNGCAVDAAGGIYKTSDAGVNWALQTTAGSSLYSLCFGNSNKGTAVGAGGIVMSTSDGGNTWTTNTSSQGYGLASVFFVDADTGYAVGNNGTIIKTTNAGILWQQKNSGTISPLSGVFFTDVTTGYAVGSNVILKTTDRGNSWTSQASAILTSVYFTDANTGYATADNGTIIKTTDAGLSWNTINSGANALYSIRFADSNTGFAVGASGTILKTTDAGAIWVIQNSGTSNTLNSVCFTDANNGYAVGTSGTIINTTDGGCSTPPAPTASGQTICSGNTATLTATAPGGTYEWYDAASGGTLLNTNASYNSPTLAATTTYYVQTTGTGCTSPRTSVTVTVNPAPAAPSTSSNSPICSGTNLSLTAGTIVGATYFWTGPNAYTSSAQNPTIVGATITAAGIYSVTATLGGCTSSAGTTSVTVNPAPTAPAASNQTICSGNSATLTATAPGGTYQWYDAPLTGTLLITATSYTTLALAATTTYYVQTTIAGCTSSRTSVTVTVNPAPIATISYTGTPYCQNAANPSPTFSGGGVAGTFSSTAGLVFVSTATGEVNLSASTSGTYTVTNTIAAANGCPAVTATSSITITPLPIATFSYTGTSYCQNAANPSPIFSGGGIAGTFTSSPAGLIINAAIGEVNLAASTAGTYTVTNTIAASGGCTSSAGTTIVTVNPIPVITSATTATICSGATVNIPLTSTITSTYNWIAADNANTTGESTTMQSSSTLSNTITNSTPLAQIITYTVTATSLSGGCTISQTVTVTVNPSTSIYGHVSYSLGDVASGKIIIYLENGLQFDSVQVATLDANGIFNSPLLNPGNYLVKAFADTSYHTLTPTYNGNVWDWNVATVIVHDCSMTDTANIAMVEVTALVSGPGSIGGIIQQGIGFGRQEGDPIPGLDVKLGKNPGGATNIVASTQTDGTGYYFFGDLALNTVVGGSYIVYADIPGLGMTTSYDVILDATNPTYDSLNYAVDSTSIYPTSSTTVGISNPEIAKENKFKVYPNPFKGNANIEYYISNEAEVTLEVVNVLGVKIKSLVNSRQSAGNHKCNLSNQNNNLSSGVYFITLTVDGKASTQRIMVME